MTSRVYFVGSGFSRAISSAMPTLSELSDQVRSGLRTMDPKLNTIVERLGNNFELWLSFLSEDRPWLRRPDNLRNQASFLEVSGRIAELIRAAQLIALGAPEPVWLRDLVLQWYRERATVVTFNYDVLIESAYGAVAWEQGSPIKGHWWIDLYQLPLEQMGVMTGTMTAPRATDSFSLLKLHGSLNWWYSGPNAIATETPRDEGIWHQWTDQEFVQNLLFPPVRDVALSDKVPLIVPPTAAKSGYYQNSSLRTQWELAAKALRSADELVLLGYSAPQTDLLVRSLLSTNFDGPTVTPVDVHDTSSEYGDLFRWTSGPTIRADYCDGVHADPIAKWVADNCGAEGRLSKPSSPTRAT